MTVVISDNIVLPFTQTPDGGDGGVTLLDNDLKKAYICYKTIVTSENITASSQSAGYPVTNISNPLTAHRWKPSALPANAQIETSTASQLQYMGIAGHTLSNAECVIAFQYSTNNGSSWTTIKSFAPGDNKPILCIFDVLAPLWRIQITRSTGSVKTAMPSIGVFMAGAALKMQRGIYVGHTPITLARKTQRITNKTEGGQYAGSSIIKEGVGTTFEWKNLTSDWYRENFDPFVVYARSNPFFIAWRYAEFPYEVGFVWTTDDIKPQNTGPRDFMSVSMSVEGYSDE